MFWPVWSIANPEMDDILSEDGSVAFWKEDHEVV